MGYFSLRPDAARENARPVADPASLAPRAEAEDQRIASRVSESPATAAADPVARAMHDLAHYDVLGIERVAAICCWGRSGSYLLASFLDGHPDVITMPFSLGELIYPFWEKHGHLSLREKLLAYPGFVEEMKYDASFFSGEFGIDRSDYHASVTALLSRYADQPGQVLESRATFFRFLVVAYNVAFGRRPGNPQPLIVHQHHIWSNTNAQRLLADFPHCRFIHTVRDPLSCFDSTVEHFADLNDPAFVASQYDPVYTRRPRYNYPAWNGLWALVWRDTFHKGMEARSITIRFEDMHSRLKPTMTGLAQWLGIAEDRALLDSTFNGKPWIVTSRGKTWSGARRGQVQRRAHNMWWVDRALVFALFQENFAAWGYPYPKMFAHRWLRALCLVLVLAVPMRSELVSDRNVMRAIVLPALRGGQMRAAGRTLSQMLVARVGLRVLMFAELCRRIALGKRLAHLL